MLRLLEEILTRKEVRSADGALIPLHSEITAEEGALLQELIAKKCPAISLEVGLAFGVSALFICEALSKVEGKRHIVIDPWQGAGFGNVGLRNLEEAGFGGMIDFREQKSHIALPELAAEGARIDFAFIDGFHTFDHVLLDFFYVDLLLRPGGIVVFDDVEWPAIHRVCRYVATNRAYRACAETGMKPARIADRALSWAARRSPRLGRVLNGRFSQPDEVLGFSRGSSMVAFEKLAHDDRKWDFDQAF